MRGYVVGIDPGAEGGDEGRKMVIVHPPVTAFSPRAKIEAWVRELEQMRAESGGDRDRLEAVEEELEIARGWLREADEEGDRA